MPQSDEDTLNPTRARDGEVDTLAATPSGSAQHRLDPLRGSVRQALFGTGPVPRIGRFTVLRLLGRGGMGTVFAAYDEQLDRRVAVKLLRHDVDERSRARVEREARAMAKLTHPNVVAVYEVGEELGELFIAMEYVQGQTLEAWQRDASRSWREILAAYMQAGEGLAAAHAVGLVHRDFKPQNAMVELQPSGRWRVRVLDFGLARIAAGLPSQDDSLAAAEPAAVASAEPDLTATGNLLGTPAYMAPEQFTSSRVGEAADQFSFCVALWEGLYGCRPFSADSLPELVRKVTTGSLSEPPRDRVVPSWLRAAGSRGLAVAPDDRWPSMHALLDALARDPSVRRRRWGLAATAVLLVGIAAAGGQAWWTAQPDPCADASEHLDDIWDSARSSAIEAAIVGTDLPYAPRAWTHAAATLDDYTARWTTMFTEACAASTSREQAADEAAHLAMACLQRARQGLKATTDVLTDADRDVVQNLETIVGALPKLDRCANADALLADVDPPRPEDAQAVEQIRARVAEARAELEAYRYARASTRVDEAQALAQGVEYPPVHAEIALERGRVLAATGEYDAAGESYRVAMQVAAASDQREVLLEAVVQWMYVTGDRLGRADDALQMRPIAIGLADGLDPAAQASAHMMLATVLDAAGAFGEAEVEHRRALALFIAAYGPRDAWVATAHRMLGRTLNQQGKHAEAEAEVRASLSLHESRLGPEHPAVARSLLDLGTTLAEQLRFAEAEQMLRRALASYQAGLGAEHPNVAPVRLELGDVLYRQAKYTEAEDEHRRALALLETFVRPDNPYIARARGGLGAALAARGEYAEAEPQLRQAIAILDGALAADHIAHAEVRLILGRALLAQARPAQAEPLLRQALRVFEHHHAAGHPMIADTQAALAEAHAAPPP